MRAASRMTRVARALTLVAAVLLGTLFVTPLWSVRLVAPQYPEGLGMTIRLNTIEGVKEHDLRNINALNHYIGMKVIEPDAIPELQYMPWIVAGLIAAGLAVAALGRRRLLVAWTSCFAILGAAGMYDFWRWSHDYGHNLDLEKAVIVVPGMTYQPPLIGTKQLLNFTATSLPAIGGVLAGVAFALALAGIFLSYRHRRPLSAAIVALSVAACGGGLPHIDFGRDACAECRMIVSDRRFGAVLVTQRGKELAFDSIECLLKYQARQPESAPRAVWVVAAEAPGTLIPLAESELTEDASLRPPMGKLVSFGAARAR